MIEGGNLNKKTKVQVLQMLKPIVCRENFSHGDIKIEFQYCLPPFSANCCTKTLSSYNYMSFIRHKLSENRVQNVPYNENFQYFEILSKPENILVDYDIIDGEISNFSCVLADFGTSKSVLIKNFFGGTPVYAGPRSYENYGKDLFSFARLALELFLDQSGICSHEPA